jgi:hypothetical protein
MKTGKNNQIKLDEVIKEIATLQIEIKTLEEDNNLETSKNK